MTRQKTNRSRPPPITQNDQPTIVADPGLGGGVESNIRPKLPKPT